MGRILIGVVTDRLFSFWCVLEINILSFVGVIVMRGTDPSSIIKYFIAQTLGSMLFLWAFTSRLMGMFTLIYWGVFLSALLKIGAAPVHVWMIRIIKKTNWDIIFWLLVLQKILPFYLLRIFLQGTESFVVVIRGLIGILGAWSHKNLKTVLAYYSVFRAGWIIIRGSWEIGALYLILFGLAFLPLCTYFFNQTSGSEGSSAGLMLNSLLRSKRIFICFLSLVGVPPLLGFFSKILILYSCLRNYSFYRAIFMLFCSLVIIRLLFGRWGIGWFSSGQGLIVQSLKTSYTFTFRLILLSIWVWLWIFLLSIIV